MIKEILAFFIGLIFIFVPEPATTLTGLAMVAGSLGYSAVTGGEAAG